MSSGKIEFERQLIPSAFGSRTPRGFQATLEKLGNSAIEFVLFSTVFIFAAYYSVSAVPPNAIPVHHDDYTNYASGSGAITIGWVRPLSTVVIQLLAGATPDLLIWSVRLLTIVYIFLNWRLFLEFCGDIRFRALSAALYAAAVLATPVVVEYGRYTGMITHLISGCLAVAAALILIRQIHSPNLVTLYASVCLFVLSTLAKEDFVLLYVVSVLYVLQFQAANRMRIALAGIVSLTLGGVFVLGAKLLAKSAFLGIPDPKSTYFIDTSPVSIAFTVVKYLKGAMHPAMTLHGDFVLGIFVFSLISLVIASLIFRRIPGQAFFVFGGLAVIAPYSLLPNHVNAYYELLWLPFFVASAVLGALHFADMLFKGRIGTLHLAWPLLFAIALAFNFVDYSGRRSIASWYDSVSQSNSNALMKLVERTAQINQAGEACILGVDMFSPWYMHDGSYLLNVLGLNAHWTLAVDAKSPIYQGIYLNKGKSSDKVSIVSSPAAFPNGCDIVDLSEKGEAKK